VPGPRPRRGESWGEGGGKMLRLAPSLARGRDGEGGLTRSFTRISEGRNPIIAKKQEKVGEEGKKGTSKHAA